jgi:hypothetical protein
MLLRSIPPQLLLLDNVQDKKYLRTEIAQRLGVQALVTHMHSVHHPGNWKSMDRIFGNRDHNQRAESYRSTSLGKQCTSVWMENLIGIWCLKSVQEKNCR